LIKETEDYILPYPNNKIQSPLATSSTPVSWSKHKNRVLH